ncbi:MAG: twin-arginine translocation signal domain-containing protein [Proteobacteria bacterium]|nr:twin-arginine translocation signal domain-containing protein [Pseudomonadota bacterium]
MNRREFLEMLAAAGAAVPVTLSLAGCGGGVDDDDATSNDDDSAGDDDDATCEVGAASGTSNSHGHSLSIPADHIANPDQDRTYTTVGGHVHTITVLADELADLRDNCTVTIDTTNLHAHTWVISID